MPDRITEQDRKDYDVAMREYHEADNAEAARMMLIEDESLYEGKIMEDIYISDGDEVN